MEERFETFTVLIAKINRNIKKIKNQEMVEHNLRNSHISCLYYLYRAPLTATELCERCEEDKATISRSLDYLEKNGYVFYNEGQKKSYKKEIFLTEKGKLIGDKIYCKVNKVLEKISLELGEDERTVFYASLATISDKLEEIVNLGIIN